VNPCIVKAADPSAAAMAVPGWTVALVPFPLGHVQPWELQ
jgi:hypothetical protein